MSKVFTKTLVALIVSVVAFGFIMMPTAQAFTAEEQAALEALGLDAQMITALSALLGGDSMSSSTNTEVVTSTQPTGYVHGATLRVGSRGAAVTALQAALNSCYSAGLVVDGVYGPGTAAGVRSAQAQLGVSVDGIVGPVTGGMLGTCTVSTTVETDDDMDMDDDDMDDDEGLDQFVLAGGDEATIEDFELDDGDDDDVEEAGSGEVAEITFDVEDSDVLLERLDLVFKFTGVDDGDDDEPWDVFEAVRLIVNGDEVAEIEADDDDEWDEDDYISGTVDGVDFDTPTDDYRLRFSGLNEVLPMDEETEIIVEVDIANSVDLGTLDESEWDIAVPSEGIRMVDEAGLTQETPNTAEAGANFTIETEGAEDALEVSSSSDDPDSATLVVDDNSDSDVYDIHVFEMEAEEDGSDLVFDNYVVAVIYDNPAGGVASPSFNDIFDDVWVEIDGDEYSFDGFVSFGDVTNIELGSTVIDAGTDTVDDGDWAEAWLQFELNDDVEVDAGDEVEVVVKARFSQTNDLANYDEATRVKAAVSDDVTDRWDVEGSEDLEDGDITGSSNGDLHKLFEEGIDVTLEDSSYTETVDNAGDVTKVTWDMEFEVEAFGETFFIPFGTTRNTLDTDSGFNFQIESDANAVYTTTNFPSNAVLESSADTEGNYWRVDDGDSEMFTATVSVEAGDTTGFVRVQGLEFRYDMDSTAGGELSFNLTPAEDFDSGLREIDA